jgi:RNA polymerase sigma-70 factor (ECF subfamily)
VLEACVKDLPEQQGRVFMMREWLELSTDDTCKELNLTTSNLWVLLHRARTRLQVCLNTRWFTNQTRQTN